MLDSLWKWAVYLLILGGIIFVGWKQPLRYRFMSQKEIDTYENPPTPVPVIAKATPEPIPWMYDPSRRTKLDQGSYNRDYSIQRRTYPYQPTPYPYRR